MVVPESCNAARELVDRSNHIVVVTGAGISTDSGIPDYRGPQGVWTKNPEAEKLSTIDNYIADPEVRARVWQVRLHSTAWDAAPNLGHRAVANLQRRNLLDLLITQNVDGLHRMTEIDPDKIVEIHGTIREVVCLYCDFREPMGPTLQRVSDGEVDPACPQCGGILKSATVSFGQNLVTADLDRSFAAADSCDLLIAIGTNLSVFPIASVVPRAHQQGAAVIIVNATSTAMDELADVIVSGSISDVLPQIFGS